LEKGIEIDDLSNTNVDDYLEDDANQLREDVELVEGVYPKFNVTEYLDGKISPVFFGSALNNFGVKELLDNFIKIAPSPIGRESELRNVLPDEDQFSGFVFKIHANMDPNHRDRIAFVRIVSGTFKRNAYYQHVRLNRKLKFFKSYCIHGYKKKKLWMRCIPETLLDCMTQETLKLVIQLQKVKY